MRGSTSSANGFPLIFRVIFRFICTQPSVVGGAPDSSGPVVYDGDEYFGEMQGGARFARLCWLLAAGCAGCARLGGIVRDCAVGIAVRAGGRIGQSKPIPLGSKELAYGGAWGWDGMGDARESGVRSVGDCAR